MTTDRSAVLALIAAKLELARADQAIKKSCVGYGRISAPTVAKVLAGKNHKLSTLIEVADALDCDVEILIHRRAG